jgi:hypothetical protein
MDMINLHAKYEDWVKGFLGGQVYKVKVPVTLTFDPVTAKSIGFI